MIPNGATVRLIVPTVQGTVLFAEATDTEFGYRVRYTLPDGEVHERFFEQSVLEEVK